MLKSFDCFQILNLIHISCRVLELPSVNSPFFDILCISDIKWNIENLNHLNIPKQQSNVYNKYTMFVKIATPRRRHVTEIKFIPQIRYMAIDKRLELQNCTWSVSLWFQYGVKPPCAAISLSASWHGIKETLDILLGNVPPCSLYIRVHKASRVGVGDTWQISCRPTISQTCSMGEMSGEHVGQGSSDTRRLWKKACTIFATCDRALSCWNMACGVAWRRGSTSGSITSLM